MRFMFAFGVSLLLGLSLASAHGMCSPYSALARMLQETFNEVAVYTWPHITTRGHTMEFWANEETGTFTLVRRSLPLDLGCITAIGQDLKRLPLPAPGDPV